MKQVLIHPTTLNLFFEFFLSKFLKKKIEKFLVLENFGCCFERFYIPLI
jgi:hypothetical protein